jgi:hypothetical protein
MLKRIAFVLLFLFAILIMGLGANSRSFAQNAATVTPIYEETIMPDESGVSSSSLLVLTLRDDGRTFTVPIRGQILLRIPHLPNTRLRFDPAILRLIRSPEPFEPQPRPNEGGGDLKGTQRPSIYPNSGWLLLAIRPGVTLLTLEPLPCLYPPCPMMPEYSFSVTIVVRGTVHPSPPPPPAPPNSADEKYIGSAFLEQTVLVKVGQIVRLDLPFLPSQQRVRLQFDPAVLRPLPNQSLTYPPSTGWRFSVIGAGTSSLVVHSDMCPDQQGEGTACPTGILFRVTITTQP